MKFGPRVIVDVVILTLVFLAPWWLSVLVISAGILFFNHFFEAFIFALILDGFHGIPGMTFYGLNILFLTIITSVFIVSLFLRTRLKFYSA